MSVYQSEEADYFDAAVRSVWTNQSVKPMEIVLIEDGPLPAKLRQVVEHWKRLLDHRLVVLKNDLNLGLTKSLNKGLDVVRGELIARMDSDDVSEPDRFERQVKFLMEHPEIDIVGGSLREFNEDSANLRVRNYPLTHEEAVRYICKASPLAHPTVMMRRRMFDDGLRYNEKYRMSQDVALWFDAIMKGYHIANVPEVTINFRSQGDVFRRRSRAKAWNEFVIYMKGIYRMNGLLTLKYRFPMARLCFRLMPPAIVKFVYGSQLRSKFLDAQSNKSLR